MNSAPNDLLGILETNGPQLHALLVRLTLRTDVAEDLLQELFLKLRCSKGFQRAENRAAYAFRAAIHLAVDWRRSNRGARNCATLQTDPSVAPAPPLERLIVAEELERVVDVLPELPEMSRTVLVLHHLQHLGYDEIARQLGKTEHQARALCSKAIRRLRALLRIVPESPGKGRTRS